MCFSYHPLARSNNEPRQSSRAPFVAICRLEEATDVTPLSCTHLHRCEITDDSHGRSLVRPRLAVAVYAGHLIFCGWLLWKATG